MQKKERSLYKSGENNPHKYIFCSLTRKERRKAFIIVMLCIFGLIVTVLEAVGITNWNKVTVFFKAVDGIKVADTNFAVYYLDVDQSDCTIVVCDGEVMVIDTGTYRQLYKIREALFALEIENIDYLVVTHQHDDHMSGAERLMKLYDVKNIIMPKLSDENAVNTETYNRILHTIAERNVNAIAAQDLESFNLGTAKIDILAPREQYKELNNMSVVMKATYGETSFLFQGDAESKIERYLINSGFDLTADVLKAGHHGSKTATTEKYIDAVNPKFAVISCGIGNSYGHPRVAVIDNLVERDIDYYITVDDGDISVGSDGKNIFVNTQKSDQTFNY